MSERISFRNSLVHPVWGSLCRRFCWCLTCLVMLCLLHPAQGLCAGSSEARQALQLSVSRILSLIKNPDYVNPATREPLRLQIEDEVYHIFDFEEFSARTVGQGWKNFTSSQKQQFADAFASLLFSTYLSQIDGYNGEEVFFTSERSNESGTRFDIATELTKQDGRVIPINYRLMPKNGTWVVYDVFVEGVSLVRNYRTQFQQILMSSSPDELIAKVRQRAQEVGSNASAQ